MKPLILKWRSFRNVFHYTWWIPSQTATSSSFKCPSYDISCSCSSGQWWWTFFLWSRYSLPDRGLQCWWFLSLFQHIGQTFIAKVGECFTTLPFLSPSTLAIHSGFITIRWICLRTFSPYPSFPPATSVLPYWHLRWIFFWWVSYCLCSGFSLLDWSIFWSMPHRSYRTLFS